jgi:hypothetical protein
MILCCKSLRSLVAAGVIGIVSTPPALHAASVARWTTYQGTANHHGFVDTATRLPASAMPRWSRQLVPETLPAGGTYIGLAIADRKVFVTSPQRFTPLNPIVAVDLLDGSPLWDRNYPDVNSVNPPAVSAAGDVYFITGNHMEDTFLRVLDGDTGTPIVSTPMEAQWQRHLAPTIFDGRVGTPGGEHTGLHTYLFDGSFLHSSLSMGYDMWTPTPWRDQWVVYTDRFRITDRASGELTRKFLVPGYQAPFVNLGQTPVIIGDVAYLLNADRVLAFDLIAGELIFARTAAELGSSFLEGQIATDGRQLFVGAWPEMLVLDRDGALQDSYANPPGAGFGPTHIVTRTHVFAWSSFAQVNVFDRQTGERVLTFDNPNKDDVAALAMADQTLVVAYRDGTVSAFDVAFETIYADGFERID